MENSLSPFLNALLICYYFVFLLCSGRKDDDVLLMDLDPANISWDRIAYEGVSFNPFPVLQRLLVGAIAWSTMATLHHGSLTNVCIHTCMHRCAWLREFFWMALNRIILAITFNFVAVYEFQCTHVMAPLSETNFSSLLPFLPLCLIQLFCDYNRISYLCLVLFHVLHTSVFCDYKHWALSPLYA